jgi:hypothetical protein
MSITIETKKSVISFEEPDLVRSITKPHAEMEFEDILESAEAVKQLVSGNPYFLVIITDETATYSKESREHMDSELEPLKKGEALVVTSLSHRILAVFYARTRRRHHPIRVFATEWEALEWIASVRAKEGA